MSRPLAFPLKASVALVTALIAACDSKPPEDEPKAGMLLTDEGPDAPEPAAVPSASVAVDLPSADAARAGGECLLIPKDEVQRVTDSRYLVDRAALTGAVTELSVHPERWLHERALSWDRHGGAARLRVYGIDEGARCGVENGDRIISVHGIAVTDPALRSTLADRITKAGQMELTLSRDGRQRTVVYEIVERLPD